MKNIWRVLSLLPNIRQRIFKTVLISSLIGWSGVLVPFLYKYIIDSVVGSAHGSRGGTDRLELLLVLLGFIYIVDAVFDYFGERIADGLWMDAAWGLRQRLYAHLSGLSVDYYEQNKAGEIIQRVMNGVVDVARWTYNLSQGALVTLLTMIFIMALLLIKIPPVGFLLLVAIPLNFYLAIRKVRQTRSLRKDWLKLVEKANGEMTETITHISTIRSFAQEDYKVRSYNNILDQFRLARSRQFRLEWNNNFLRQLVSSAAFVAGIAIVAFGTIRGTNTIGDILLVSMFIQRIVNSIQPLSRLVVDTGDVESSAERLTELLDVQPALPDAPDAVDLDTLDSIEFRKVGFTYPGQKREVLSGISFDLKAGQSLALVGPSGVGKSTLTKLLLRFYAPTSGQILINGQDISSFTQQSLRSKIGMVMQEVALFNDTVEENLRFARPEASAAELSAAAALAHADSFIDSLPKGYKTVVGERGVKLSGGEKQRVAIARAMLRQPDLIILDEATSALDSQSESLVQDGLRQLMHGRTAVIIAHRLSTVMNAEKILVLKDGRIVEQGTHEELVNRKSGLYAKLYQLQTQGAVV